MYMCKYACTYVHTCVCMYVRSGCAYMRAVFTRKKEISRSAQLLTTLMAVRIFPFHLTGSQCVLATNNTAV